MFILLLLSIVATALAGTECPPRENIYPCSCVAVPTGKRNFFTTVTCHRLGSTDALMAIVPSLRTMTIDHFYLYDSFWEANQLEGSLRDNKQTLPTDWMTILKIKEIEIVDTTLSPCFACPSKGACRNSITQRFTAKNSSSHEKICTLCDSSTGNKFSWTGCLTKLRQFHFRDGQLTVLRADMFPIGMRELAEVDFSHNRIAKIESNAFKNIPKLRVLNLSHNSLQSLNAMFSGTTLPELVELDVSWNFIKTPGNIFSSLPKLRSLKAESNLMAELNEGDWKAIANDNLRLIDLSENPLQCDCHIVWINSTFPVDVGIAGTCSGPEDYEGSAIRRASRLLASRCEGGTMGTRGRTTKRPATKPYPGFP